MFNDLRCANAEPHEWHEHEVEVEVTCSGRTRCGVVTHDEHVATETQEKWCEGVCGCGRRDLHGPGEHK